MTAGQVEGVAGRRSRDHLRPSDPDGVQASTAIRQIAVAGARGGQGTSTVAAAIAVFAAGRRPTRLVSDEPAAMAALLGIATPAPVGETVVVTDGLELGGSTDLESFTVVDAGRARPLPAMERAICLVVVRGPCYLALRHLVNAEGGLPDGIVLAKEAGRSLTAKDVSDVTGVPVVAQIDVTADVARTIDAGLLVARLHRLDELAPLRHWITRQLAPRRTPRSRTSTALLTAVNERHRLSTCAKRK
jgi:hypothetical protein